MKINRRGFLHSAAGGAMGLAVSGGGLRGISRLNAALEAEQVRVPGGPEAFAPSVCSLCPGGCGLRVRTIGKRAVKIQGNPLHPVNHGGLCPKGFAGLQALYHPDRLRAPMKNTGTRQAPRWRQISWEEALGTVAARLRELRRGGRGANLVFLDRRGEGLQSRLFRRFTAAYGSQNYLQMPGGLEAVQAALYFQQGATQPAAYDLENTRYLLSFGVDLLEGWGAPAWVMRTFGRWRDPSAGRRTKFVQVEPRLSLTAARADEWVTLRPGSEAALALGIAYVLISEGLYDTAFVRDHTFGFDDWRDEQGRTHLGFRTLVTTEYRLNEVAEITGAPAETILRLGREFGRNRPALAIGDRHNSFLPGNPYAAMAVHSLNALTGSIDAPGGALLQADFPGNADGEGALDQAGLKAAFADRPAPGARVADLPAVISSRKPFAVEALLINEANPVFALPNGGAFRQAFTQVPFIVSLASFLDETSAMADMVLPLATDLERWQAIASPPGFPYALHSISPPVIAARHGTRHPADLLLELARRIGGPLAAELPFADFEQYLRAECKQLFAARSGSVFSPGLEDSWNRLLERSGWWAPTYSSEDELWDQIKERGGWWDPIYYHGEWERALKTPSGRFEFYSQALAQWAASRPQWAAAAGMKPDDDHLCLPHQPALATQPPGYPLLLVPVEVLPFAGGEGAHLPYLQQIAGAHLFEKWESWLEIHPETAAKLGIADGDRVWVESRRGQARAIARLYKGVRPDVVHLPLGYGHTEGSEWARRGVNPLDLIEDQREPLAGLPQTASTFVKVYRM